MVNSPPPWGVAVTERKSDTGPTVSTRRTRSLGSSGPELGPGWLMGWWGPVMKASSASVPASSRWIWSVMSPEIGAPVASWRSRPRWSVAKNQSLEKTNMVAKLSLSPGLAWAVNS